MERKDDGGKREEEEKERRKDRGVGRNSLLGHFGIKSLLFP